MNTLNRKQNPFRRYGHIASGLVLTALLASSASLVNADPRGPSADGARHANAQHQRARMENQRRMKEGTRTVTHTRPDGATATRTTTVDVDRDTQTRTRTVEGERFDGGTYSSSDVMQRTDTGFTRDSSRTNSEGVTVSRSVVATVDKEAGTMHKEITVVDKNGETHTKTVDRTRGDQGGTAEGSAE